MSVSNNNCFTNQTSVTRASFRVAMSVSGIFTALVMRLAVKTQRQRCKFLSTVGQDWCYTGYTLGLAGGINSAVNQMLVIVRDLDDKYNVDAMATALTQSEVLVTWLQNYSKSAHSVISIILVLQYFLVQKYQNW